MVHEIKASLSIRLALFVLIVGVVVRIFYFNKFGVMLFQHDWQGHIDLIKYLAQHGSFPAIPNKGWEYPQQPLYYLITASIYTGLESLGFQEKEILFGLGYFSLFCAFIFLIYGYRLVQLLTDSQWVQTVVMIFIALTPSIVYMSTRINNDVLVMALSSISLFYIVRSYQNHFERDFWIALVSVSLLFMTKVSSASIELLFFVLLLMRYVYAQGKELRRLKHYLFIYGIVGIFLLSFTLWRLYLPLVESFYMVNSAKFPQQTLEHLDSGYFTTFHFMDLIKAAQSHVFGVDAVRHSFLTYQYGTLFFGEFDYKFFWDRSPFLSTVMQSVYLFGMVYVIALLSYLIHFFQENRVHQILFGVILINLVLILKFVIAYPSICNTDYRYFVSSFILFGVIFGQGLAYLNSYSKVIKYISSSVIVALVLSEGLFFYLLMTY